MLYKITIRKVYNKVKLMMFFREFYKNLSLADARYMVNNLPINMATTIKSFNSEEELLFNEQEYKYIKENISNICEISVKETEVDYLGVCEPGLQHTEYVKAKEWYLSLNIEHQKLIDILIAANIPCG